MARIDQQEVATIAHLARLEADVETRALFAEQLDSILSYMDTLNELDTTGVEPLYSPVEHATAFRQDEAGGSSEPGEVLDNAPESDGQYFIVPKVV